MLLLSINGAAKSSNITSNLLLSTTLNFPVKRVNNTLINSGEESGQTSKQNTKSISAAISSQQISGRNSESK